MTKRYVRLSAEERRREMRKLRKEMIAVVQLRTTMRKPQATPETPCPNPRRDRTGSDGTDQGK